jgi:ParB family chromosome partitioning protein
MDKNKDDNRLGRGLSALIQNSSPEGYKEVFVSNIIPNPYQPRMDATKDIENLSQSIEEHGVLSPLIVSKRDDGKYQLIAGERRLNAAKAIKLEKVPVIIKEASSQDMLIYAIVENLQRKDLNVMEEAVAIMNLKKEFNLDNMQISKKIGLSDRSVRYYLKILSLPDEIKDALYNDIIIYAHAVGLIRIESPELQKEVFNKIVKDKLSPARTTDLIDKLLIYSPRKNQTKLNILSHRSLVIQNKLKTYFGDDKIALKRNLKGQGSIIIKFKTDEELEDIYKKINSNFES